MIIKELKKDKLAIYIYDSRKSMGDAAGHDSAEIIRGLLKIKEEINIIFAAAPQCIVTERAAKGFFKLCTVY